MERTRSEGTNEHGTATNAGARRPATPVVLSGLAAGVVAALGVRRARARLVDALPLGRPATDRVFGVSPARCSRPSSASVGLVVLGSVRPRASGRRHHARRHRRVWRGVVSGSSGSSPVASSAPRRSALDARLGRRRCVGAGSAPPLSRCVPREDVGASWSPAAGSRWSSRPSCSLACLGRGGRGTVGLSAGFTPTVAVPAAVRRRGARSRWAGAKAYGGSARGVSQSARRCSWG